MTRPPIGLMSDQLDEEQSEPKTQYGVVTGRVVNLLDPLAQARVQVQFPWLDGTDLSAWARVAVPTAGPFHGMYFMPNICLLYTSDAADERSSVDLGGCRLIKKKKHNTYKQGPHRKN